MWYSGIDQHKQFCVITTYGPEGPRVKQSRVASTPLEVARYFAEFPGPHRAVVESTGGWYWLADTLAGLGVELVLAHATRVKAIAAAKVKTDQVDSDTLALLLRADLIPMAHMIAPAQRGARDLMRTRLRLVEKSAMVLSPTTDTMAVVKIPVRSGSGSLPSASKAARRLPMKARTRA